MEICSVISLCSSHTVLNFSVFYHQEPQIAPFSVHFGKIPLLFADHCRGLTCIPPFSILDSQVGEWLKQRNQWEEIIKNRSENVRNITAKSNTPYINKFDYDIGYKGLERNGNISTFDPFLCEILVKWFSREQDVVFDPFAGGHVRGAVSGILGR